MRRIFICLFLIACLRAQSQDHTQPFGKIDTADLKINYCDFEKDANAMVLFDKCEINFDAYGIITYVRHKRIKIFNVNGKDEANIQIPYIDDLSDIAAETINLTGGIIEFTPVDEKLIYKEKIDKHEKAIIFTFPNVKAGSVIELKYKWKIYSNYAPAWYFQSSIPTLYSKIEVTANSESPIKIAEKVNQPFLTDTNIRLGTKNNYKGQKSIRALSKVHSYKEEPYMTPTYDNLQRLSFKSYFTIWQSVCNELLNDKDFGLQLDYELRDEKVILAKAESIKNKDIKIDSIFNIVKNRMLWNKKDRWFTNDGIKKAWDKKTGNSTEINLILCRLLCEAGINAYPMAVSTPDYGTVDPNNASLSQFNKAVVYIPIDSVKYYVLDATDKHNLYNQVPFNLLSSFGLAVAIKTHRYTLFSIQSANTAKQLVFVDANIKPGGKMTGKADIVSDSYNRNKSLKLYNDLGEKKYRDNLADDNNDLKISSLEMENIKADSLPLKQHINFSLNLTASDENYIYFNPNLFTSFGSNPFLSETRYSNIDFTYNNSYIISGIYKIPDGYKTDVLPKSQTIITEDKSISFKRIVGEQDGAILVRYIINRNQSYYTKDEYPELFQFYKKMFQMLNEQIVLKKS